MSRLSLLAVVCCVTLATTLRGDESPGPPSGEIGLESGRVVDYTIHFDRNSLRASIRLGDNLIALTSSGTLLRFELPAVRLVRERIDSLEVACLGRGEGEAILAGLSDGRVCRVDPATLELTDVLKLPEAPQWIGWCKAEGKRPAGLVAVTRQSRSVVRDGRRWNVPASGVHDLATGKTFATEDDATTFLLDRSGRLWLGSDRGEWGGHVTRVDLTKGTVAAIKPPPARDPDPDPEDEDDKAFWQGVYGFIELRDGQVWAFGGTSHMGFNSGEITRVDEAEPRTLFAFDHDDDPERKPDPDRPRLPITHVVEEKGDLLVFSYSDVFRVDPALKSWKQVATLDIAYRWGRPDAVGSYPSVRAVHPPTREGEPLLLATIGDGYVDLDGKKATAHAIPGQLGASAIRRIENTSEGTLFFEGDDRLPIWKLGPKGWEIATLDPAFEPDPDDDPADDEEVPPVEPDPAENAADLEDYERTWNETQVLAGPGGVIYTVSGTAISPGTRTTARRVDGKPVRLGRETSSLNTSASFITADGTLWNANFGELRRFQEGRWEAVAKLPREDCPYYPIKPLGPNGPPWLLLDHDPFRKGLWQLEHVAKGEDPRFTRLKVQEGGKTLSIDDAIPWSDDALLLATDAGLRAYAPSTGKLSRVDLPEPRPPATRLVRDGLGRLWLGGGPGRLGLASGKGLWLSEPGVKAPEAFDRVPWVGRSPVHALAPDPQHADGVIVALGPRGVAFLRAKKKP